MPVAPRAPRLSVVVSACNRVFPQVPVRQWVLSFSKRLRYFLARDADLLNRVIRIFLNSVEKVLLLCSPDAPDHARLGAVTFVHRFAIAILMWILMLACLGFGAYEVAAVLGGLKMLASGSRATKQA